MSDRRVEVADLQTISQCVDDLQNLLKEGSLAEQKAFIRSFVKEIRVTGNEAVLSYFPPILPEKLALERAGVPPTVQYGGRYWTRTAFLSLFYNYSFPVAPLPLHHL